MDLRTDEAVQQQPDELVDVGALEYVLPSEPLGERWVLGVPGSEIVNLDGDQVRAFLLGTGVLATAVAKKMQLPIAMNLGPM